MIKKTFVLIQLAIFIIASIFITFFSWQALQNPKSYGFYRFFALEAILIIILLNIRFWIKDPLSPIQLVSWLFLFFSLIFVIQGLYLLQKLGGFSPRQDYSETYNFEYTTNLINAGIYKYIRHPLYSALLLLAWCTYLKHISIFSTIAVLFATASLIATAKMEEHDNILSFGSAYTTYIKKTKMFIPYLF
jgi:protein-S-isoprenylcysteine O-methyltransferase Ste14